MTKTSDATENSRRDFLKLAVTAAPAAVAAVTVGASEATAAPASTADGLQDTVHTRNYYASARF